MTGPNTLETNGVGSPAIFQPLPKPGDNCHRDEPVLITRTYTLRDARIYNLAHEAGIASIYAERIVDLEDRLAALAKELAEVEKARVSLHKRLSDLEERHVAACGLTASIAGDTNSRLTALEGKKK